ncbi:MAG: hypothetical protein IBV52_09595 [Candidatus Bathyarchaeota archaeon]
MRAIASPSRAWERYPSLPSTQEAGLRLSAQALFIFPGMIAIPVLPVRWYTISIRHYTTVTMTAPGKKPKTVVTKATATSRQLSNGLQGK